MVLIEALAAVRYPQRQQTDLVAPPYDVLSAADKAHLLKRNPHNIVAVDLPHVPPKAAGPAEAYKAAGKTLHDWISQGVLQQDTQPGLYPYQQIYRHDGITYRRRGLFCRVQLEDFGPQGTIHPHEQTFSGPKEDRLLLMRATAANLSPVFGLFDDAANDVTKTLFAAIENRPPSAIATLPTQDGADTVLSELWAVTDDAVLSAVRQLLRPKHLYIADGHHRYSTSLTYRRELSDRAGGHLPANHPANYALFVLIAMQDPGLIVLPTHRVVANLNGFSLTKFLAAAGSMLKALPMRFGKDQLADLEKKLPGYGPHAMGIYDPQAGEALVVVPTSADPLAQFPKDLHLTDKSAAWRQLDVAILQHLIFDKIVAPTFAEGKSLQWAFPHEAPEVAHLCAAGQFQAGFLLQPTALAAVRELCTAGELMPQKSTFFYPKLATGMVLNLLDKA